MIGSVLDKYQVLQKLGEGATATVYRGRHLTIGKDVAIKVLHPHLSASSRYRERFNREARAVGRLSHQNIVSILDYSGQGADDCYIVTELVDGITLLGLLQERGRLPSEIAALAGADLASALGFAHKEGIIHRDIKPENVMIRRDGRIKLMDFGVARVLDESSITLDGSLLGSPAYMSPQQALDETLDGRSDLFSLGTVLFHAVTGHVPFSGSNASVILRNVIEGNRPEVLELAPEASPAIAAVIDRLLQPRPDDRYPTAEDARDALLTALAEVRIPPDHPTINLRAYLVDAEACEAALASVLHPTLLEVGKERLARGDTLGALQLFNRLLAIDEDNAEVIALIQSLHQAPAQPPRATRTLIALAATALLALSGGAWWVWGRGEVPVPRDHLPPPETSDASPNADPMPTAIESLPGEPTAADTTAAPTATTAGSTTDDTRPASRPPTERRALAPPAAVAKPASLVFNITEAVGSAEVWVDGALVGHRKGLGGSDKWIGTDARPLQLPAGKHLIEVRAPYAEAWREEVQVSDGERKVLAPPLRRLKVEFSVNPRVPDECILTVGDKAYTPLSAYRSFQLRDPEPTWPVVFECPAPLGTIRTTIGATQPGGTYILPKILPSGAEP